MYRYATRVLTEPPNWSRVGSRASPSNAGRRSFLRCSRNGQQREWGCNS